MQTNTIFSEKNIFDKQEKERFLRNAPSPLFITSKSSVSQSAILDTFTRHLRDDNILF